MLIHKNGTNSFLWLYSTPQVDSDLQRSLTFHYFCFYFCSIANTFTFYSFSFLLLVATNLTMSGYSCIKSNAIKQINTLNVTWKGQKNHLFCCPVFPASATGAMPLNWISSFSECPTSLNYMLRMILYWVKCITLLLASVHTNLHTNAVHSKFMA